MGRYRSARLDIMLTDEEKEMLNKVARLKGMTYTELIINWIKEDYQKIK